MQISEKFDLVSQVFSSVSNKYDLMNDLMSAGSHRIWKRNLVDSIAVKNGDSILDLACGSGDIASLLRQKIERSGVSDVQISLCDENQNMLDLARNRLKCAKDFTTSSAESLSYPDNSFDIVTLSFGLRNFSDIPAALCQIYRVLKPNGRFYCLEFFPDISNPVFKKVYNFYLSSVIPRIGKVVTQDYDSYSYFAKSIINFMSKNDLINCLQNCQFKFCDASASYFGALGYIRAVK